MKSSYEGLKEIGVDVDDIMKDQCPGFRVSIGFLTLDFDCLMKWNPVIKVWRKSELMLMKYEGKC